MSQTSRSEPRTPDPDLIGPELIGPFSAQPRIGGAQAWPLLAVGLLALALGLGASVFGTSDSAPSLRPSTNFLEVVPPGDPAAVASALAGLQVTSAERTRIGSQLVAGELQVGLLTLWDWKDHDGDAVAVTSAGFVQNIEISKVPKVVVVPFSGPGEALITGLHDGGGGITIALATPTQPMQLRPLWVGDSIKVAIP